MPTSQVLLVATPSIGPSIPTGRTEDWQREFWWEALEFDPATGLRIHNEVGIGIPRRNTKSTMASARPEARAWLESPPDLWTKTSDARRRAIPDGARSRRPSSNGSTSRGPGIARSR